ncbi:MAG: TM2 domain-containing protein [Tidjanibacter sp.]|nr:TM2 domain-containing protein [Tidjanibacter sp.]
MKKLFLTIAVALMAICAASAANYSTNDEAIDALVADATEMVVSADAAMPMAPAAPATAAFSQKNPWIATILGYFLGYFGVHRLYLGAKPLTCIIYIITFGGIFYVVPFIDSVLLLLGALEDKIPSEFVGSSKFIVWI